MMSHDERLQLQDLIGTERFKLFVRIVDEILSESSDDFKNAPIEPNELIYARGRIDGIEYALETIKQFKQLVNEG